MKKVRLGRTGLEVTKTAMGCLPVQRCSFEEGVKLIRAAYEGGINYFDTANAYTDSEEKLGAALCDVRSSVVISTKSHATDGHTLLSHIENSLKMLKTDYIDIYQLHNAQQLPDFEEAGGLYAALDSAKKQGLIRHIGITAHKTEVAEAAVQSGRFDTLQFPFNYLSPTRDITLAEMCDKADVGFIAMKPLAGGLLSNASAVYAFMQGYDNVVPIYGIQRFDELEQWLSLSEAHQCIDERTRGVIDADRAQLAGSFCHGCGYCMPCPKGIPINMAARMNMLLRRSPWRQYYSPEWREKMARIDECIECRNCSSKCPYELDTPNLLKYMLKDYREFYKAQTGEEFV